MEDKAKQLKTLLDAVNEFADLDKALDEAAESRWPNGVSCPRCGGENPSYLKTRRIWKCSKCRKQFSFKAGTVFEDSPIGLDKWLPALWMIANCRNGTSSWELHRAIGVTQKTAWFMLHRIRLARQDDLTGGMLGGEVEVDETYIGGKARNMHKGKKEKILNDGGYQVNKAVCGRDAGTSRDQGQKGFAHPCSGRTGHQDRHHAGNCSRKCEARRSSVFR